MAEAEFQTLSRGLPLRGNEFSFISERLAAAIHTLLARQMSGLADREALAMVTKIIPTRFSLLAVIEKTADTITMRANHTMPWEQLVVMPILGGAAIAAAVAIPSFINSTEKGRLKTTLGNLKTFGTAIDSYITDNNEAPRGKTPADLQTVLVPFFIKVLPLKDGWGNDLLYIRLGKDEYAIASPGKDGIFAGWEQQGLYDPSGTADDTRDIIYKNGQFIYGPRL
jgi:type II secretory pathway pseudopilin PulG